MKEIDARGVPCPGPVITTKKEVAKGQPFTIMVSGSGQAENIQRAALRSGAAAEIHEHDGYDSVMVTPSKSACCRNEPRSGTSLAVSVPRDSFGSGGDADLEEVLCRAYFHTLTELRENRPSVLVFYDRGVFLALDGSPVLEDLKLLEKKGVRLLVCGTCLTHYGVSGKLAAGVVSNMYEIASELGAAGRHYAI